MQISIRKFEDSDRKLWDDYVQANPKGTLYHLSGWKNIIEKTYGHKTYYLMATDPHGHAQTTQTSVLSPQSSALNQTSDLRPQTSAITGLLPLVHMKHFLFGNRLISMPFMDIGGILADNEETEQALLAEALKLAKKLKATEIELRQTEPLNCLKEKDSFAQTSDLSPQASALTPQSSVLSPQSFVLNPQSSFVKSNKSRMLLKLPESSEILWKSFKSKLRSQIKKPIKEGLTVKIDGLDLIDNFYRVFLVNMRDLGSPVHSKNLIKSVLSEYAENAKILIVYKGAKPVAGSIVIGLNGSLHNPWASSLRDYARLSPNMLLYWSMLEYAVDNNYNLFDFGRSTPDEGTYKFKKQWGAIPSSLHWHYFSNKDVVQNNGDTADEKTKFEKAIQYWQKLPVPITRVVGPMIRKHIGL